LYGGVWAAVGYLGNMEHCGACRNRCCAGDCDCRGNACTGRSCTCDGGPACDGGAGDYCCPGHGCVDLGTDEANCGACNAACAAGEECVPGDGCGLGRCQCPGAGLSCGSDERCCPGTGCTDVVNDPHNCGACGVDCSAYEGVGPRGDLCAEGDPGPTCYCGRVGVACDWDDVCTVVTEPADADCGCMDLQSSASHCGSCGNECDQNEICSGALCLCAASGRDCAGEESCCLGSGCVDLRSDLENCGACGESCGPGETCVDGTCRCGGVECDARQHCCAGTCRWETCCSRDDDCNGDQNPDCNERTQTCFCDAAKDVCDNDKLCCPNSCKNNRC
jgi:hypothetical protein